MSTSVQPTCLYSAARMSDGQSINLGSSLGINVDGNHSFSIGLWARISTGLDTLTLLAKGDQLALTVSNGQLVASMANTGGVTAAVPFGSGLWHYVVFTYAATGSGGGELNLYVDGVQGIPLTQHHAGASGSDDFVLGGPGHLDVLSVSFWDTALSKADCVCQWTLPETSSSLTASFDFSQIPAQDVSGNGYGISYKGGACQVRLVPALTLLNAAAEPNPSDELNPSSGGPFSIHGWVYALAPSEDVGLDQLMVLGCGTYDDSTGTLACYLDYSMSQSQFAWAVQRNGPSGPVLTSTAMFAPEEWHHVAVTYDGNTMTLYIDGNPSGSGTVGALTPLSNPRVLLGGIAPSTTNQGTAPVFKGYMQSVGVWTTCLTEDQVQQSMGTNADIAGQQGCAAYFDFSSPQVSNQVTGNPVGLTNNASVGEQATLVTDGAMSAPRAPAQGPDDGAAYRAFLASALPELAEGQPTADDDILPEARIKALVARYRTSFAQLEPDLLERLSRKMEQNLRAGVRAHAKYGNRMPGSFFAVEEGSEWAIYHQHPTEGAQRCDAIPKELANAACIAWIVSVVATTVQVVLSMLGVGYAATAIVVVTRRVVTVQTTYGAIARVIQEEEEDVSSSTFIKIIQTLFNTGNLFTVVAQALANVSWWSWLFTVASIVIGIVAIWTTGGAYLFVVLGELALSVVRLEQLIKDKPSGC